MRSMLSLCLASCLLLAVVGQVSAQEDDSKRRWFQRKGTYDSEGSFISSEEDTPEVQRTADAGYAKSSIAYPTGNRSTSTLLLEKHFPLEGRANQPYDYKIVVKNLTELTLQNVRILENIPAGYTVQSAEPAMSSKNGDTAVWTLSSMSPSEVAIITISGVANSTTDVPCCTSADWDNPALCHNINLINPSVEVDLAVAPQLMMCDRIPLEYTVKNTGDSRLENVVVRTKLPEGVTDYYDKDYVSVDVGELEPGEYKEMSSYIQAKQPGQYSFQAQVLASDVEATSAIRNTSIVKPEIQITASTKRDRQFLGRDFEFEFVVTNTGVTDALATAVQAKVPSNAKYVTASDNGRLSGKIVKWDLGTIKANQSKTVSMTLNGMESGIVETEAAAKATCCDIVSSKAALSLAGIPALLLEVVDLVDPIEVGDVETYVIKVTNQGTDYANNVKIKAEFVGMKYISDNGATPGRVTGTSIDFAVLPRIAPKDSVTWNIKVSGVTPGDLRFKASMNSEELTRDVEESESTYVY